MLNILSAELKKNNVDHHIIDDILLVTPKAVTSVSKGSKFNVFLRNTGRLEIVEALNKPVFKAKMLNIVNPESRHHPDTYWEVNFKFRNSVGSAGFHVNYNRRWAGVIRNDLTN